MILGKEINYMNLPGWNEQPDSDQLSDQNKQLRNHYFTAYLLHKYYTVTHCSILENNHWIIMKE